jgi:hypothetical protein
MTGVSAHWVPAWVGVAVVGVPRVLCGTIGERLDAGAGNEAFRGRR